MAPSGSLFVHISRTPHGPADSSCDPTVAVHIHHLRYVDPSRQQDGLAADRCLAVSRNTVKRSRMSCDREIPMTCRHLFSILLPAAQTLVWAAPVYPQAFSGDTPVANKVATAR